MDFFELTLEPIDVTSVARRVVPEGCGATVTLDGLGGLRRRVRFGRRSIWFMRPMSRCTPGDGEADRAG